MVKKNKKKIIVGISILLLGTAILSACKSNSSNNESTRNPHVQLDRDSFIGSGIDGEF